MDELGNSKFPFQLAPKLGLPFFNRHFDELVCDLHLMEATMRVFLDRRLLLCWDNTGIDAIG
jgi:hypothetical protein